MKKLLCLVLTFALVSSLLFGCASDNGNEEDGNEANEPEEISGETEYTGSYPIEFDLTEIYENIDAAWADYDRAMEIAESFEDLRGTLDTAEGWLNYFSTVEDGEFVRIFNRIGLYSELLSGLDASSSDAGDADAMYYNLYYEYSTALSFVSSEIGSIPLEKRKEIASDPMLSKYSSIMRFFLEDDDKYNSEEVEDALSISTLLEDKFFSAYENLNYVDGANLELELPDGTVVEVDDSYFLEVNSGDYDEQFRYEVADAYYGRNAQYINTYASLLEGQVTDYYVRALKNGFDHVLDYELYLEDVDRDVYENQKQLVLDLLPYYHEYLGLVKESAGLENMYFHDTLVSHAECDAMFTYDAAVEKIETALSVLGDDYVSVIDEMVKSGHIDVFPSENKSTGAFEIACSDSELLPFVLFNFTGNASDVNDLAHELGHAGYDTFSERNEKLNYTNNCPTIFNHEVASTINEIILNYYSVENAVSDEEKLYYIEQIFSVLNGSVIRQIVYTEFEEYLYECVENGYGLDAEDLSDKWIELFTEYYGENVDYPEGFRYYWAGVPHFYYGFYVYKYSTSATYAFIIANDILSGKEGARDNYIEYLESGSSESPCELVKIAGVDPFAEETSEKFIGYYKELVDMYGSLA